MSVGWVEKMNDNDVITVDFIFPCQCLLFIFPFPYSTRTKLKLYHSCVLTTLLYGSECWRLTEKNLSKLSTFHIKSLRRILRIFWPNVISNKDLFERCRTEPMATYLDEETLEVDWPRRSPRNLHCKNRPSLDARRETKERSPKDHMATDG